jgi:hypothetical protein
MGTIASLEDELIGIDITTQLNYSVAGKTGGKFIPAAH